MRPLVVSITRPSLISFSATKNILQFPSYQSAYDDKIGSNHHNWFRISHIIWAEWNNENKIQFPISSNLNILIETGTGGNDAFSESSSDNLISWVYWSLVLIDWPNWLLFSAMSLNWAWEKVFLCTLVTCLLRLFSVLHILLHRGHG